MKLSILLLFFVPFLAVAQPRITQSQVIKPDGNAEVSGIANETATGNIFLLRYEAGSESRYQWAVDVFSPDLKLLHRNKPLKLDMPGGEDVSLGHAVTLGGKPHLMFLKYRKKDDKTAVYRSTLQSNGLWRFRRHP